MVQTSDVTAVMERGERGGNADESMKLVTGMVCGWLCSVCGDSTTSMDCISFGGTLFPSVGHRGGRTVSHGREKV